MNHEYSFASKTPYDSQQQQRHHHHEEEEEEEEEEEDKPFVLKIQVGLKNTKQTNGSIEIIARRSTSVNLLKVIACKEANVNECDYDLRFKGQILRESNNLLQDLGVFKGNNSFALWENDIARRRKVEDELDEVRREKQRQYELGKQREYARRDIEKMRSDSAEKAQKSARAQMMMGGDYDDEDVERASSSYDSFHHHREQSPNNTYYNNTTTTTTHNNEKRQQTHERQALTSAQKRRIATDQLQKIIADVDALKFRCDDIHDINKNDPEHISEELKIATKKNAREAYHLLEKSILDADAIDSHGFDDIRQMRKGLVARVESILGKLEHLTKGR